MIGTALALLIAAGVSAAAGIAGGAINAASQAKANEENKELQESINQTNIDLAHEASSASALEAQKNRDWQTEMSNTAYQRQVADMRAAGLNPYAALDAGGAAVTGGATGQVSTARAEAARVNPVGDGGALASLASTAQSLAFMMALNSRNEANIKSREGIASLNNATKRYIADSTNDNRAAISDRWINSRSWYRSRYSRY